MSSQELRLTSKQISNTSPFQHRTLLNLFELLKFHPHEESLTLKKIILACQQALHLENIVKTKRASGTQGRTYHAGGLPRR